MKKQDSIQVNVCSTLVNKIYYVLNILKLKWLVTLAQPYTKLLKHIIYKNKERQFSCSKIKDNSDKLMAN